MDWQEKYLLIVDEVSMLGVRTVSGRIRSVVDSMARSPKVGAA